jgi:hypothetical protein
MCPVVAVRVAYTGELGWELHHPIEMQNYLWDLLMEAGGPLGMKLVGARAQNWLRQEKSYRAFGTELGRDATPLEAGLERFVDMEKDFHGKARMEATGIRARCVTVLIDGPDDADPWGREGLFAGRAEGRAADLGRLFGGLRQVHRDGLCGAKRSPRRGRLSRCGCRAGSGPPPSRRTAPTTRRTRGCGRTAEGRSGRGHTVAQMQRGVGTVLAGGRDCCPGGRRFAKFGRLWMISPLVRCRISATRDERACRCRARRSPERRINH